MIFIMVPEIKINTQNYVCLAVVCFPANFIEINTYSSSFQYSKQGVCSYDQLIEYSAVFQYVQSDSFYLFTSKVYSDLIPYLELKEGKASVCTSITV
jgi:hypothetical protein